MEESSQVLNITKEQNKLPKTKSRARTKKQGAKSTTRDTELGLVFCAVLEGRGVGGLFSSVMLIFKTPN